MSIFYCCLAKENTKRVYQFLKKGLSFKKESDFQPQSLLYDQQEFTICFRGKLINQNKGEDLLKKHNLIYHNDKEYLIALYCLCRDEIKEYISKSSFLLIDDGGAVFIYSNDPLYFARKRKGEIFVSTEKEYIEENNVFKINGQSCLFFFNNNLKLL